MELNKDMTYPVPPDWIPDCESCFWHVKNYDRKHLYLFYSRALTGLTAQGWHVNLRLSAFKSRDYVPPDKA